jgi:hypothetical protein
MNKVTLRTTRVRVVISSDDLFNVTVERSCRRTARSLARPMGNGPARHPILVLLGVPNC